ncbi:hypothetical protein [Cellulomonas sp. PS-H5]|uniref:hypothetical protein n=1 Tax=Cellulomonas sp. PS-H5 TaxID=2820400 RepID=UPI001C4EEB64|nr:hypothetical protein [Cellulomonas sp. PS-H5]MBW0252533.1 hypothetical protein [Cellulomonas sp. PS-H5]
MKLDGLRPSITAAESYVAQHIKLDGLGDSGLFITAIGVLDGIRTALESELAHLGTVLESSAQEVRATAASYRTTDDATAATMDRLYHYVPTSQYGNARQEPR